jgi:hypothetical protein
MWNDAVVFWFKVLCLRLSWGTDEKYERLGKDISSSGRNLIEEPFENEPRLLAILQWYSL